MDRGRVEAPRPNQAATRNERTLRARNGAATSAADSVSGTQVAHQAGTISESSLLSVAGSTGLVRWWSKPASRPGDVLLLAPAGEGDECDHLGFARAFADAAGRFVAVHLRQSDIEQHRRPDGTAGRLHRLQAVVGDVQFRAPCGSSSKARLWAESRLSSTTRIRDFELAELFLPPGRRPAARAERANVGTGRWTMNSLPLPGPLLWASIVPPCISTRPLTSARPMPSPPCDRSSAGSPARTSRRCATDVGGDADAGVPHGHGHLAVRLARHVSQMCPPFSVYLAALLSRFEKIWDSRVGSASRRPVRREG